MKINGISQEAEIKQVKSIRCESISILGNDAQMDAY